MARPGMEMGAMVRRALVLLTVLALTASLAGADGVRVTGRAAGPDGQPGAEARVWLIRPPTTGDEVHYLIGSLATTETGEDGSFILGGEEGLPEGEVVEGRSYDIVCHKAEVGFAWRSFEVGGEAIEVELEALAELSGKVLDKEGEPVEGAAVEVLEAVIEPAGRPGLRGDYLIGVPPELWGRPTTGTDREGKFTYGLLPKGTQLRLRVSPPEHRMVHVAASTDEPVIVDLRRRASLSGRVVCEGLGPIEGLAVRISVIHLRDTLWARLGTYGDSETLTTDEEGRFALEGLPPGECRIRVEGKTTQRWRVQEGELAVELAPGQREDDLEIELTVGWPVKGRVVADDTGEPIDETVVSVHLKDREDHPPGTRTDEEGRFVLYVPAGEAHIWVESPKGFLRGEDYSRNITVVAGQEQEVREFRVIRAARVSGRVVNEQGEPVAGAEVLAEHPDFRFLAHTKADEEGGFEFDRLQPGCRGAQIYARSEVAVTAQPAVVNTDEETAPFELVLFEEPACRLLGRVIDERGDPVAGARVSVSRCKRYETVHRCFTADSVRTDEQGRFESAALLPDFEYHVNVRCQGFNDARWGEELLEPGQVWDVGEIVMRGARGSLVGVVVDEKGEPVEGVTVFNAGDGPQRIETQTDADGRFELEGLWEGAAYAFAQAEGYELTAVRGVAGGEVVRLVLRPAGKPQRIAEQPDVDAERDRMLAQEIALECMELRWGTRHWGRMMAALIRANPTLGLERWQEAGRQQEDVVLVGVGDALLERDPDQALDWLWEAQDASVRARELNRVGRKLAEREPELAAEAFSLAATAARALGADRSGVMYLAQAGQGLLELGRPEGEGPVREAFELAQQLGVEQQSARGAAAEAMALLDVPAALSLLEGFPDEHTASGLHDRHVGSMACALAGREPGKAREALSRLRHGLPRDGTAAQIAYAMAQKDLEEGLAFAGEQDDASERAHALGCLALWVAEDDRERAFGMLEEAVGAHKEQVERFGGHYGTYEVATDLAVLAWIGAEIGYPDVGGLVTLAMSLRYPAERPLATRAFAAVDLAQALVWVSPEAARHVLEPVIAELDAELYGHHTFFPEVFVVAAAIDTEWAVELLRAVPADVPEDGSWTRTWSHAALAEYLSLSLEERVIEKAPRWVPGKEPD